MSVGKIEFDSILRPKIIVRPLPAPSECPDGTTYGNYSLKLPNGWRVLDSRHVRSYGTMHDTQTAFTRCYLKSLPKRKMRREQKEAFEHARVPQYCQPSESRGSAFYVDIESAYLSIYKRMSWGIEYLRGHYFSNDGDRLVYPFPIDWKSGRSYVITGALPATRRFIAKGRVHSVPCANPNLNLPLACAVWDVLAAIARFAIDVYGARYYNLDGAVVSERRYFDYLAFLDSLNLRYQTKYSGRAVIRNLGQWQIGEDQTKRYDPASFAHRIDAVPVTMSEAEWILDRFLLLSQ